MPTKTDPIPHIKPLPEGLQPKQSSNELILFYMNYPTLCLRKGWGFTVPRERPRLGQFLTGIQSKSPVQNDSR